MVEPYLGGSEMPITLLNPPRSGKATRKRVRKKSRAASRRIPPAVISARKELVRRWTAQRRRRRRKGWFGQPKRHRLAMEKAARKKGAELTEYAARIGREGGVTTWRRYMLAPRQWREFRRKTVYRRRKKNPVYKVNPRYYRVTVRRRGRKRGGKFRRRKNPVLAEVPIVGGTLSSIFNFDTLRDGASIVAGATIGVGLPKAALRAVFREKYDGSFLARGWGDYLVTLAGAAVVSWASGKIFKSGRVARGVLLGGIASLAVRIISDVVRSTPSLPSTVKDALGLSGIGQSDIDDAVARAVRDELALSGVSDYVTAEGVSDYVSSLPYTEFGVQGMSLAEVGQDPYEQANAHFGM